jgi:pilus assembly protein CpaF
MDSRLVSGVGYAMAVVDRIARELIDRGVSLTRTDLRRAANRVVPEVAPLASPGDVESAIDLLVGFGVLEPLMHDSAITDILVNGPDDIWIERDGALERSPIAFPSEDAIRAAVERVIAPLGLRLDLASPAVDARFPDGSRLHCLIPPLSPHGTVVAIRRFGARLSTLNELVESGAVDESGAALLAQSVANSENILVCGGTGSGKTTMLNVLASSADRSQRIVTVEDAAELAITGHVIKLESRPANSEGVGEVTLGDLVRHALRLRPDRIIVGEVRGPEALDLISAMNTGHDGSMSTVHANGPEEALWRVETLALSGERRAPAEAVRRQLRSAIDTVVHLARTVSGRKVRSIVRIGRADIEEVWTCSQL